MDGGPGQDSGSVEDASVGSCDTTVDADCDWLTDAREILINTDPHNPDTDGDGYSDGDEIPLGTNPLDPGSRPVACWNDGICYRGPPPAQAYLCVRSTPEHPIPDQGFCIPVGYCLTDEDCGGLTCILPAPELGYCRWW